MYSLSEFDFTHPASPLCLPGHAEGPHPMFSDVPLLPAEGLSVSVSQCFSYDKTSVTAGGHS